MNELVETLVGEFSVKSRVLEAHQKFERKMMQWEFTMGRQNLYREDIRDLMELTVGRMDVYHVVGALLLDFGMAFYCENEMLTTEVGTYPSWLITMFMISNFCAIGFLTLSVWLAMHASVASHSISVRLLLHYVRPDIPSDQTIDKLRVPVARVFGSNDDTPIDQINVAAQNHVDQFLQRQKSWVCYEAYSRVCMALGMNSLLTALCYFIVGRISQKHTIAAAVILFGVLLLSVLLLKLDIRSEHPASSQNTRASHSSFLDLVKALFGSSTRWSAISMILISPQLVSYVLVYLWVNLGEDDQGYLLSQLPVIAFMLHAGWQWYIYRNIMTGDEGGDDDGDPMPRRLRAVELMDVMDSNVGLGSLQEAIGNLKKCMSEEPTAEGEWSMEQTVQIRSEELPAGVQVLDSVKSVTEAVDGLRSRRLSIPAGVCIVFSVNNNSHWKLWTSDYFERQDARKKKLDSLKQKLAGQRQQTQHARSNTIHLSHNLRKKVDNELEISQQLLDVFNEGWFIWTVGAETLLNLEALVRVGHLDPEQMPQLSKLLHLSEAQETQPDAITDQFRQRYDKVASRLNDKGFIIGQLPDARQISDALSSQTLPIVKVSGMVRTGTTFQWFAPEHPVHAYNEKPSGIQAGRQEICFDEAITLLDSWLKGLPSMDRRPNTVMDHPQAQHSSNGHLPRMTDTLPSDIARIFIKGCSGLWVIGAITHFIWPVPLTNRDQTLVNTFALESHQQRVAWPAPAAHFEVEALHCVNDSVLLVSSPYGLYARYRLEQSSAFSQVDYVDRLPATTVLCDADTCRAFVKGQNGQEDYQLVPAMGSVTSSQPVTTVPIPSTWHAFTAMWKTCSDACEAAVLAGWTGRDIVVAEAWRELPLGVWRVHVRFALQPALAACSIESEVCPATDGLRRYEDVRALQLGRGQTLAVLRSGGRIDGWDLTSGKFLGQWRVGSGDYTSMCHGEHEMVLVQRGGRAGPQLEVAVLPAALAHAATLHAREEHVPLSK